MKILQLIEYKMECAKYVVEKIKKFILEHPEHLDEISKYLLAYYDEYGLYLFDQLELES